MNEILARKYIKQVMKHGVSKAMANEIVETAFITSKGKGIELYINYALTLAYGLIIKKAE